MNINLSPYRSDESLEVIKNGSKLILNGEEFDFSRMSDGDTLPAGSVSSPFFIGAVDCVGGSIEATLRMPIPENYSQEQAFPAPLLGVADGPVILPKPLPTPPPALTAEELDELSGPKPSDTRSGDEQ